MSVVLSCATAKKLPLPSESVHCVITSPPYWGLRDYGVENQLGLEPTPEEYIENVVAWAKEIWRVLRSDGTLWLNLGDSYTNTSGQSTRDPGQSKKHRGQPKGTPRPSLPNELKKKNLVGIPWRVALALQADGWCLRNEVVWWKPNQMPENVTDRLVRAHEHIFLFSKTAQDAQFWVHPRKRGARTLPKPDHTWKHRATGLILAYEPSPALEGHWKKANLWAGKDYFFDVDAIREAYNKPLNRWGGAKKKTGDNLKGDNNPHAPAHRDRDMRPNPEGRNRRTVQEVDQTFEAFADFCISQGVDMDGLLQAFTEGQTYKGDVWKIPTRPFKGAHFATFPPELVEVCIKAGTSEAGCCPECGAPWSRVVDYQANYSQREPAHAPNNFPTKVDSSGWNWPTRTFKGFRQTCECDYQPPAPCTVLDPFVGSGTTLVVAQQLGRRGIGFDLNFEYLSDIASERVGLTQLRAWTQGIDGETKLDDLPMFEPLIQDSPVDENAD